MLSILKSCKSKPSILFCPSLKNLASFRENLKIWANMLGLSFRIMRKLPLIWRFVVDQHNIMPNHFNEAFRLMLSNFDIHARYSVVRQNAQQGRTQNDQVYLHILARNDKKVQLHLEKKFRSCGTSMLQEGDSRSAVFFCGYCSISLALCNALLLGALCALERKEVA